MEILVSSETSKLRSVIIGIADSLGEKPVLSDLYDPKSIENLKKGTYPTEKDMIQELHKKEKNFLKVLMMFFIFHLIYIFTVFFLMELYGQLSGLMRLLEIALI